MFELAIHKTQEISGSLLICLPHKWVKNNGIAKGAALKIGVNNSGNLVIKKPKEAGDG